MTPITILDTVHNRTGSIVGYDGRTATVQWHDHWHVTGLSKEKLESGRYIMKGKS